MDFPSVSISTVVWRQGVTLNFYEGIVSILKSYPNIRSVGCEGKSSVAWTRNSIVQHFLATDVEYLFFVDADVGVPSMGLNKLLFDHKDVVGGIYCCRVPPHDPLAKRLIDGKMVQVTNLEKGLMEVDRTGTGCMLIHRKVLEKIPFPYFLEIKDGMSEDEYFCDLVRAAGFQIFLDTDVFCSHQAETWVNRESYEMYHPKLGT